MPLAPITRSRGEPVRLCSPWDSAIDTAATGAEALRRYRDLDDLDTSALVFSAEPTWFTLQALGPREMARVRALLPPNPYPGDDAYKELDVDAREEVDRETGVWLGEAFAAQLRFGLVTVEGLPGWSPERAKWMGVRCWSDDAIWSLGANVVSWLGAALHALSTLAEKKSSSSG